MNGKAQDKTYKLKENGKDSPGPWRRKKKTV